MNGDCPKNVTLSGFKKEIGRFSLTFLSNFLIFSYLLFTQNGCCSILLCDRSMVEIVYFLSADLSVVEVL